MSNNINGGGRGRNAMSSVDFYRRVPKDLTEVRFGEDKYSSSFLLRVLLAICMVGYIELVPLLLLTNRTKIILPLYVCALRLAII